MSGVWTFFGQQFALREPRVLIAAALVIAVALALWLRRGVRAVPPGAVVVRTLAFAALALALAGPLLARPAPAGATVFVVDRSRSMGDDDVRQLSAQIVAALAGRAGHEPVGLVAFAERAAVVYPVGALTVDTDPGALAAALTATAIGSRDYTDVAGALQLAESLPSAGGRRFVLFSDGRETVGSATAWAAGATGRGIVIDGLGPESRRRPNDVRLADLRVPQNTWQGDDVEIEAVVAGDVPGDVGVQLLVDGRPAGQQVVKLTAATTTATGTARFVLQPLAPGYHAIQVTATPPAGDPIAENNALAATTVIRDKPHILIVEGARGNGDQLKRVLERTASQVTVKYASALTDRLSDLAEYDAIVLADVPASVLSFEKQKALQEFVRSNGKGLIVAGGNQSFGKGAYEGSTLEEALPVRVKPRAEGKRPPVALLLIVDASGSMDQRGTGPTRIEMAKAAAAGAVRALSPGDEIAVLAFSGNNQWVTRLRTINGPADIESVVGQIGQIKADGVTEMYGAIVAGVDELKGSKAGTRHAILLSDGEPTSRFDADEAARRFRTADLTLSTISIGTAADVNLMQRLATGGGGKHHFAPTPQDIPRLTQEETEQLAGKTTATGIFQAVQTAPSPILRRLEPAKLPSLTGYQITETKPDAQAILQSGRGEPVLAQWQYGLGRVVAWTSDLNQELAPNWKDAAAFEPFWNQAVRWTLAAAVSPSYRVTTTVEGHDVLLAVDAFDANGQPVNLADTRARLRTPGGQSVELALPQAAPGRYEARLAAPQAGAYNLELRQTRAGQAVTDTAGFSVPYPAELRGPTVGDSILGALADRTGGRVLAGPAQVFERAVLTATPRFAPIWPPFAVAALLLFLLDIAIRLGSAVTAGGVLRRLLPR